MSFPPATFATTNGELTLAGFLEMYTAMLEAQDDDSAFYANFEQLGYNRNLELDEVRCIARPHAMAVLLITFTITHPSASRRRRP